MLYIAKQGIALRRHKIMFKNKLVLELSSI